MCRRPLGFCLVVLLVLAGTAGAQCSGGCDDANPCTDDVCDTTLGCLHAPNSAPCSDGASCTTADACQAGACIGGPPATGCTRCQAAAVLPPEGGVFSGTTGGTGELAGTCGSTGSSPERVYAYTPARTGTAVISTCGAATAFDTVLYVRGGSCEAGAQLACNDDSGGCIIGDGTGHGSRLTVSMTAGQTYWIVVDGYNGRQGAYQLTVAAPSVCGDGVREGPEACDGADAGACASGQCSTQCTCVPPPGGLPDLVPEIADVSVAFDATVSAGDVAEGCAEQTTGVDLLRFSAISRNAGTADFYLGNPQCPSPCVDHPLEACGNPEFICSPAAGHNHAHYTNYARYELLDPTNLAVVTGHKQGFCLLDSNGLCANPVYTCGNQGLSAGCADIYHASLGCQYLDVTDVPSGSYRLRVTIDPFGRIPELSEANNVVEQVVTIPARTTTTTLVPGGTTTTTLPGAACQGAVVVPASGGTFTGATAGASTLAGTCGSSQGSPERVFVFTPQTSGVATIGTCSPQTSYDTVLYVRGGACETGTQLGCNDDAPGCIIGDGTGHGSRLTPTLTAGQPYWVVVDGYNGRSGNFVLTIVPPSAAPTTSTTVTTSSSSSSITTTSSSTTTTTTVSNACNAPITVPADGGTFTGTLGGASTLTGTCLGNGSGGERVYAWRPARTGHAVFRVCTTGGSLEPALYLRRGTCLGGNEVKCESANDPCSGGSSLGARMRQRVHGGETYFLVVDGRTAAGGAYTLTITPP